VAVQSVSARAAVYGGMHLLVDAACVTAVWRTGDSALVSLLTSVAVVLSYDLLAFATQAPLGLLIDRPRKDDQPSLSRVAAYAGLALSALSLITASSSTVATLLAAGFGNALFHVGAGASVLRSSGPRAAPAGLFVGPGALGLGLGMWLGKASLGPTWPLLSLLILALPLVDLVHTERPPEAGQPRARPSSLAAATALALLFLSVMIRSYVGFGACRDCPPGLVLLFGIPLAAFAGKALGGFLADALGWTRSSVGALLLSAPLLAFSGGEPALALAGLVLFQMTMPVTLCAVASLLPTRPATAFGIPSLALILGALPTFVPWGQVGWSPEAFVVLIVVSAAAVYGALRLIGPR